MFAPDNAGSHDFISLLKIHRDKPKINDNIYPRTTNSSNVSHKKGLLQQVYWKIQNKKCFCMKIKKKKQLKINPPRSQ